MDIKDLSPELQEELKACKSPEEVFELAKREGYELSDHELEGIAAGGAWETIGHFLEHDCDVDME